MGTTEVVRIQRGKYSVHFQFIRAMLSAASALIPTDPKEAMDYLDKMAEELQMMKLRLAHDTTRTEEANELR